jgi:hypothetical protein
MNRELDENEIDASGAPHSGIRRHSPSYPVTANAPVAWQYRENLGSDWGDWFCLNIPIEKFKEDEKDAFEDGLYEIRPLYAAPQPGGVAQAPMRADIAQMIDAGWKTGKSSSEVAEEILREFDASTVSSTHQSAPAQSAAHNSGSPGSDASGDAGADTVSSTDGNIP